MLTITHKLDCCGCLKNQPIRKGMVSSSITLSKAFLFQTLTMMIINMDNDEPLEMEQKL